MNKNSIVQVVAEQDIIQTLRPFARMGSKLVAGSGVIVNIRDGLVISNAHVTENTVNTKIFSSITGKRPLHCDLVSIMREKDLALLRIIPEDLEVLMSNCGGNPEALNARLVDHLTLRQGCHLYAAGYPLGTKQLQVTTGCLSGISTSDSFVKLTQYEDSTQRDPTFIVTTASLNHGMSGGGLFEESGGLVGIITAGIPGASQIGFAIPSRVLLANYRAMLDHISPIPPTLHFRWSNISDTTASYLSGDSAGSSGGMMIRHVLPDSVFDGVLMRGDLLHSLEFDLPVIRDDALTHTSRSSSSSSSSIRIVGHIESHGDVKLDAASSTTGIMNDQLGISTRKFSVSELADYLVSGSDIQIQYSRSGKKYKESVIFKPKDKIYRVRGTYHILEKPQWIKVGGVVMQNTSLNNLAECSRYKYIAEIPYYDDLIFTPSVIITHIEPSSEVGSLSAFAEGDLVIFINGQEVHSISDVRRILESKKVAAVETDRGAIAICQLEE